MDYLKRNIKLAAKNVFFHYKQYLCFFAALLVVQMFYGIITIAFDNTEVIHKKHIEAEYDYDLWLKDLTVDQYTFLLNGGGVVYTSDQVFEMIRTVPRTDPGSNITTYDVYIRFTGAGFESDFARFRAKTGAELADITGIPLYYEVVPTPAQATVPYLLIMAVITALSVCLLMALYFIRVNHYRYMYGIYMTFGATLGKLLETSFWELMIISAITLIPATVLSALIDFVIYLSRGEAFVFRISAVFKLLLFSLIVSAVSVIYPMWRVSRHYPMKLIVAEDNSNLVVSPRMSFEFYHLRFPGKYELFSAWRFRKYYMQLFLTATVFAVLFTGCTFISQLVTQRIEHADPQFSLYFSTAGHNYTYTPDMTQELLGIDGIVSVSKASDEYYADEYRSHILVNDKNDVLFSGLVPHEMDGTGYGALDTVTYRLCDSEVIEQLSQYSYSGDLNSALAQENTVIISDSINNRRVFKFKPGDKFLVAIYRDKIRDPDEYETGTALLRSRLRFYVFDYVEFTVGAVLKNNPTYDYATIYFSGDSFTAVTGQPAVFRNAEIYTDRNLSYEQVNEIESRMRVWINLYGNVTLNNTHALSQFKIEHGTAADLLLTVIGILILTISPLVWFFSQVVFCQKRENEFYVMEMLGTAQSNIRKIYIIDGIFNATAGCVIYILLSFLLMNRIFAFSGAYAVFALDYALRYTFAMQTAAVLTGLLLTALCGYFSSYIPYIFYRNTRKRKTILEETGGM